MRLPLDGGHIFLARRASARTCDAAARLRALLDIGVTLILLITAIAFTNALGSAAR